MSRSTKQTSPTVRAERYSPSNDSPGSGRERLGTEKAGARRVPDVRPRNFEQWLALSQRRRYGRSEKILRRNRKLWTRLYAKIGRRLDREAVQESASS